MPCGNKKAERSWSSIPVLLLWMIKDKLDIFDDMCLASVCRDWRSASSSYPKKKSIGDGMPWVMQENKNVNSSSRDFISITRRKKFTLDLPEFSDALVLFSKQGWILMRRKNLLESKERLPDSLFLINPFTKAKIEMPDVAELREYYASFSTLAGYPERVVLLSAGKSCQITCRAAYLGDVVWTEHSSIEQPMMQFEGCRGLITIGEQVYYLNIWGKMIIYNMANQVWRELPGPRNEMGLNYIVEHEGNIIKVFASGINDDCTSYSLSTYNDTDTAWEKMNNIHDMNNTSLYLSRLHNCFSARERGLKAYVLHPNYGGLLRRGRTVRSYNVLFHDFMDGGTQTLQLPYQICSSAKWVDIG